MDYKNIKTSKVMNKVVKEQLILRDDHLSKYAVKRIEELEQLRLGVVSQQRELLKEKYKSIIEDLEKDLKKVNADNLDGKLNDLKWLKNTSFLKGKISALLNL